MDVAPKNEADEAALVCARQEGTERYTHYGFRGSSDGHGQVIVSINMKATMTVSLQRSEMSRSRFAFDLEDGDLWVLSGKVW